MAPIYKRKTTIGGVPLEPEQKHVTPLPQPTAEEARVAASNLISFPKSDPAPVAKPKPPICYRDVLVLSRQDVVDLFDRPVTAKVKVPILGDPSAVEQEIVNLKVKIKEAQELLVTRSAAWQKRNRPDDVLPKNDRERLKREGQREFAELQTKVRELQARLRTWGTNKEDYVGKREEWIGMTFAEKHGANIILSEATPVYGWVPFTAEKKVRNINGGFDVVDVVQFDAGGLQREVDSRYNIENYKKLMSLGEAALEITANGMTWENWTRWENAAILVAITEGLVQPDMELVSRHPKLNRWEIVREVDEDDHEAERKIILKTGGGALGGATIYSRGWRYGKRTGWTQRALESFDATGRVREKNSGGDYHDAGAANLRDHSNDDNESYVPD